MRRTSSFFGFLAALVTAAILILAPGCASSTKLLKALPAAPNSAPVVKGHRDRETIQFQAADRIDVIGGKVGAPYQADLAMETEAIRQANRDASAAQIDEMASAFGVTVKAQGDEISRLTKLVTKLEALLAEVQAKLDDFGRKVAVYTANGIGALLLLAAVAVGILTKNLTYVGWCVAGSGLGFGTARVVGHWLFPWVIGVGAVLVVAGGVIAFVIERKRAADKARQLAAADDVIAAVEEIRGFLKSPPVEIVESIRAADTPEKALAALRGVGDRVKTILSSWVSEADGTAAVIDARRRALSLI